MSNNTPSDKCLNCGAGLEIQKENILRCPYCGSYYREDGNDDEPVQNQPTSNQVYQNPTADFKSKPVTPVTKREESNPLFGICLFVFILFIILTIFISKHQPDYTNHVSYLDSLKTDTTTTDTAKIDTATSVQTDSLKKDDNAETDASKEILNQLASIKIDAAGFKKLYSKTRKKYDKFSGSLYIYDRSSPRYVNYNGIFIYIDKDVLGSTLRFCIQYTADEWLFIKRITFNADEENYGYSPEFKTDNGDGAIWEWADDIITGADLDMLVGMANSKKVQARYDGDKYYKVVTITPLQKAALKKQLQIYKGLLLGYDKAK